MRRLLSSPSCLAAFALLVSLVARPGVCWAESYEEQDPEEDRIEDKTKDAGRPLSAGGLAAPGAMDERDDPTSKTERELEEADKKDSGRGLSFVWLTGSAGVATTNLTSFSAGTLSSATSETTGTGGVFGGGLGVRLLYVTLGGHFRVNPTSAFELWSLVFEGGLRLPIGSLEPYATLGAGYVDVSHLKLSGGTTGKTSGLDVRAGIGFDYFVSGTFSVGALVNLDLISLGPVTLPGVTTPAGTLGGSLAALGQASLHF